MNKKRITLDRLQNLAIVLLSLSAVFLFLQTPLFGTFAEKTLPELVEELFAASPASDGETDVELSGLTVPVRVLCTDGYARRAADAMTAADDGFSRAGSLLREALGSAAALFPSSEGSFLAALEGVGIYYDFTAELPLDLLCDALGTSSPAAGGFSVRRAFLCPDGDAVLVYLLDQSGNCRVGTTALGAAALGERLDSLEGSDASLALTEGDAYGSLSPFTLVMSEPTQRHMLSASNALGADLSELLRRAAFNPHTENRYTESSGTTVVRESYGTLRIAADGTVTYRGGSAETGELYAVSPDKGTANPAEAVAAAQKLASTLLQGSSGAASLYLSGVKETANGCTVTFDYTLGGTPLRFADGSHAVSVTVENDRITAFSMHFRSYALTDTPALLLPIRQAAAIAQNVCPGSELSVCYVDSGTDSVGVSWLPD